MKKRLFLAAMVAAVACSCAKESVVETIEEPLESTVYISLKHENGTKATGAGHGVQADDNNIKTLEVFIFRVNEGEDDHGMLDGYRKFTGNELATLTNLEVKTTTGRKMIYAVANSHMENWAGNMTRTLFEQQVAELFNDDVREFVMVGSLEETLQLASSVSFTIRRMVARVQVNSVVTAFDGTPYQ